MKDKILKILNKAAREILEVYSQSALSIKEKDDFSPLTEADLRSHDLIVSSLKREFSYPILSEEDEIPFETRRTWGDFWLLDPLDGTKEFINRNGEFTINLALISSGMPVIGAVMIPTQGACYFAEKGLGAFKIEGFSEKKIFHSRQGREPICLESRFHSSPQVKDFCRQTGITTIEQYGSSIKFCRIAEGLADVYPRFGPTMEWDVAAAQVVLEEAGGKVVNLEDGTPLFYNKPDLKNPGFLASAGFFQYSGK